MANDLNDQEILNDFVTDCRELLDEVEPSLIALGRSSADKQSSDINFDTLNNVFRLFHSLKGSAGFLNLDCLVSVAHHAESLLDKFRSGVGKMNLSHIEVLCNCCDLVRKMLSAIEQNGHERNFKKESAAMVTTLESLDRELISPSEKTAQKNETKRPEAKETVWAENFEITSEMKGNFVQESDDTLRLAEANLLILAQMPDEESLQEAFRCLHSIKGNAGFLGYRDIEKLSHHTESALEDLAKRKVDLFGEISELLLKVIDTLKASIGRVSRQESADISDLEQWIQKLDVMVKNAKTSPVQLEKAESRAEELEEKEPKEGASVKRRDIRVDLDKLDALINLVGELVIAESMVINNPDLEGHKFENFEKASRHLIKISRDLQDIALAIRMVPLASTFKKMIRLVHDLGRKTDKKIDLIIKGEETEIDKTLVELISDPLVHLLRNSADHGIETPQERADAGKPEKGTIRLEAKHEEGEVWIMVSDDGRGLNKDKILKKALEKGLITSQEELTEKAILKFIFEPGFSTAEKVSDISGRGVGLDVLKKNLEKLKGQIDIRNRPGLGCTFILKIPLTLAIIEGMLVSAGNRHYTIPLLSIRESIKVKMSSISKTMDGQEMLMLRNNLIPIVRLHELHVIDGAINNLEDGILVIVESSVGTYALFVDRVLGQQQTVIKPLSEFVGNLRGVSGCTIMGNGDISLILDLATLVQLVKQDHDKGDLLRSA